MAKYKVGGYVRLSRDDDYSESDSIQRQMDLIKIIANICFITIIFLELLTAL